MQETSGATILANILPGLGIDDFLTRADVVAGVTSHFLTDALGSPVAVTDNAGVVQTEYTYESFGRTIFSGSSNSSSYQYTGRENDGTGLFYYRNRYFHPSLQRFISEDPLNPASIQVAANDQTRSFVRHAFLSEYPDSTNFYTYVGNKPLTYTDPSGLIGLGESAALGAGLGGGTGWVGARKPLAGAAIAALFGATYSPLIYAQPLYGPVGAIVGAVTGFASGMAAAAVGDPNNTPGAIAAGIAGGIGGGIGGFIGGGAGAVIGTGIGVSLGFAYGAYAC